jgi:hypothetical protein
MKFVKGLSAIVVFILLIVWIAGSSLALYEQGDYDKLSNTCPTPYRVWAVTWPLWKISPVIIQDEVTDWSFSFCKT